jgi:hypothetical protein
MDILARIAADPNVSPVLRAVLAPRIATVGTRKLFSTSEQAREYEAGWSHWPEECPDDDECSAEFEAGWRDRDNHRGEA